MDIQQESISFQNIQSQKIHPIDEDPIEDEEPKSVKVHIDHNPKVDIKKFVYTKTKSYWLNKINQAKEKNKLQDSEQTNNSHPKIIQVIKNGLEVQDYMQKYTSFFKLYLQEIKPDYVQYGARKKRFVPQAKMMLKMFMKKNKNAAEYFSHGLDWVEHGLRAFSYLTNQKLNIQTFMQKLVHNKYTKVEDFNLDMDKMFEDSLVYNFKNEKMTEMIMKLKESWEVIKAKVIQLHNFTTRSLINPSTQMLPQMMDINAQINLLKRKVSIWNSGIQELDYDPYFFEKKGLSRDNNLSKESQNSRKKQSAPMKKRGRQIFESCNKRVETISRERMLGLKNDIMKRIGIETQDKSKTNRKLFQYIHQTSKRNNNFIGLNNEINLEILSFQEFVQLETFIHKYLNE